MKRVKAENYRNNDKDKGSGSPIHIERKVFDCGGYEWVIPAAYSDAQEINIDICRRIPVEALRSFRDKWGDKDRALLTQEQSALRNCDDPLRLPVKFSIEINGEEIRGSGWNKTVWQPDDSGEGNIRAKELLQLYGLAPDSAWLFYRAVVSLGEGDGRYKINEPVTFIKQGDPSFRLPFYNGSKLRAVHGDRTASLPGEGIPAPYSVMPL